MLALLAQNPENTEIARQLGISSNTVHVHMLHIFRKLGVSNRKEAYQKFLSGGVSVTMAAG